MHGGHSFTVGKVRADMPWVENELSAELVELVKGYRVQTRPKVLELIAAHGDVRMPHLQPPRTGRCMASVFAAAALIHFSERMLVSAAEYLTVKYGV